MGGGDHDHRRHERRGDRSDYGDVQGMWGDDDDLNDFDFGGDDVQDNLEDLSKWIPSVKGGKARSHSRASDDVQSWAGWDDVQAYENMDEVQSWGWADDA